MIFFCFCLFVCLFLFQACANVYFVDNVVDYLASCKSRYARIIETLVLTCGKGERASVGVVR
jgi:hypothetical protein